VLANNAAMRIETGQNNQGHTWDGLAVTGTGRVQVASGYLAPGGLGVTLGPEVTLEQSGGYIKGASPLVANGPFNWTGGTIGPSPVPYLFNGGMTLGSSATKILDTATITNNGTATWTGGDLGINGVSGTNGLFVNAAGATFNIQSDTSQSDSWGEFRNYGTVVKRSSGTTIVNAFNSTGTIRVEGGILLGSRWATWSGSLQLSNNAIMRIHTGGSSQGHTWDGVTVVGTGRVQVVDGYLAPEGAGVTLGAQVTLEQSGGLIRGVSPLTAEGPFNWTAGTLGPSSSPYVFNGGMTLGSPGTKIINTMAITNRGVATWTGGDLVINGVSGTNGLFVNAAGATFNIQGGSTQNDYYGEFRNQGTVVKSLAGITFINAFNSTGTVRVEGGTLQGSRWTTWSGSLELANNAAYRFQGVDGNTTQTFDSLAIGGQGALQVAAGILLFKGSDHALGSTVSLELFGGRIKGAASITVNGPFNWSGGLLGEGVAPIILNGTSTLSGVGTKFIEKLNVTNNGVVNWTAGEFRMQGVDTNMGRFINQTGGVVNILGNVSQTDFWGEFRNLGTVVKNSSGQATVNYFYNQGTLKVEQGELRGAGGGTWGGNIIIDTNALLRVDNGSATYTLDGLSVSGPGVFSLTGGTLFTDGAGAVFGPDGSLSLSGGRIRGNGPLTVNGIFNWTGGYLGDGSGAFNFHGPMNLGGAAKTVDRISITNHGTANLLAGGSLHLYGDGPTMGRFVNAADGMFNFLDTAGQSDGNGEFLNLGTVVKNSGGTVNVENFHSRGSLRVENGTLRASKYGTWSGSLSLSNGATIRIETGNSANGYSWESLPVAGAGKVEVVNGHLSPTGAGVIFDPGVSLELHGGAIKGTGPLLVQSPFLWKAGTLGPNANGFAFSGGMTMTGNGGMTVDRMNVTNLGAAHWTGGSLGVYGDAATFARFVNATGATFHILSDNSLNDNYGEFRNEGTAIKGSPGTTVVYNFQNTGDLRVEGGVLRGAREATWSGSLVLASNAAVRIETGNDALGYTWDSLPVSGTGRVQVVNGFLAPSGAGLVLAGGVALEQSGGRIKGTGPLLAQSLFTWSGGYLGPNTNAFVFNGGMNLAGPNTKYVDKLTVTNAGVMNWADGSLQINGDANTFARFVNATGAVCNMLTNSLQSGSFGEFQNLGSVVKSSSGTAVIHNFSSAGAIRVENGTLRGNGSATWSGVLELANNAAMRIETGNSAAGYTWRGLPVIGQGTVQMVSGYLAPSGAGAALDTNIVLEVSGGVVNGDGPLTVNGPLNWTGGTLGPNPAGFLFNGVMNLDGPVAKTVDRLSITNRGVANWTAGTLQINGDAGTYARFVNAAGATFNILGAGTQGDFFGEFRNLGAVRKTSPDLTFVNNFHSSGLILIEAGTLRPNGSGAVWEGSLVLSNNAVCRYEPASSSATHIFRSLPVTGQGTVLLGNGNLLLEGDGAVLGPSVVLELNWAKIKGPAPLVAHGVFNWNSGTLGDNPSFFQFNGGINLASTAVKYVDRTTVTNSGTAAWTGGTLRLDGVAGAPARFVNTPGANFQARSDNSLAGANAEFWNLGQLQKTVATGVSTVDGLTLNNAGTLDALSGTIEFRSGYSQTNGLTRLAGGQLRCTGGTFGIHGGRLAGNGLIEANVALNGGTLAPGNSPGAITINGNLTMGSQSVLEFELGGATPTNGHDFIDVNGVFTAGGRLSLLFLNGFQNAVDTNGLTLVTANSAIVGAFTNAANGAFLASSDSLKEFRVNYGGGSAHPAANLVIDLARDLTMEGPRLFIQTSRSQVELSWTTPDAGFQLRYSTNLPTAPWLPVAQEPQVQGDSRKVLLPFESSPRFFRLQK